MSKRVLFLIIAALFFCLSAAPVASETVRIGISPEGELALIAHERGFFKKAGLDVVLKEYPSGKRALEGMFAGEVDIATSAETPFVFKSLERSDFSLIASIGSAEDEFRILARNDSGILKTKDLKGKRIAVQKESALHFFLHLCMMKQGLSEKDVKLYYPPIEEQPEALASGTIDAIVTRYPFISEAQKLLGYQVTLIAEPGLYQKIKIMSASNNFIEKNRETIRKILNALVLAEDFVRKEKEKSMTIISDRMKVPYQHLFTQWPHLSLRLSLDQQLLLTLEEEARWAVASGLVKKGRIPNYLNFIHADALKAVKPHSVTIIK